MGLSALLTSTGVDFGGFVVGVGAACAIMVVSDNIKAQLSPINNFLIIISLYKKNPLKREYRKGYYTAS